MRYGAIPESFTTLVKADLWHRGPVVSRQQRDSNQGPLTHSCPGRRSIQLSYLLLLTAYNNVTVKHMERYATCDVCLGKLAYN